MFIFETDGTMIRFVNSSKGMGCSSTIFTSYALYHGFMGTLRLKLWLLSVIHKLFLCFLLYCSLQFENMVLRRIFGPRRGEVTGECRRLHNEELNDLYSSPNLVRVIKPRRMRWAGHVARMGEEREVYRVYRREGNHWGDLGIDGWIILGWIYRRWDVGIWTGLGWPRVETVLVSAVMNLRVP